MTPYRAAPSAAATVAQAARWRAWALTLAECAGALALLWAVTAR